VTKRHFGAILSWLSLAVGVLCAVGLVLAVATIWMAMERIVGILNILTLIGIISLEINS